MGQAKVARAPVMGAVLAAVVAGALGVREAGAGEREVAAGGAFPVPIIEVKGTGEELGRGHGGALKKEIGFLFENYLRPFVGNEARRMVALTVAAGFEAKMRPQHVAEVKGLAAASGINPREAMLAQCFLDIAPAMGCSTVALPAEAAADGVARLGRNLDFPSLNVADKHSVVFVVKGEGKNAYAAVGWPGMVGVLSGMNEHGLVVCNMEVGRSMRGVTGMPYTLLYRTVLEECGTVDEAIALIEKENRQTANNLMVMDARGGRAVVEITPEKVVVRRGIEGKALISTNHQRGEDQETGGRCRRYDTLRAVAAEKWGKVDEKGVEGMLRAVQQGRATMQAMVFEPGNRVIYLAVGERAAGGTFYRLELGERFGVKGDRPAAVVR